MNLLENLHTIQVLRESRETLISFLQEEKSDSIEVIGNLAIKCHESSRVIDVIIKEVGDYLKTCDPAELRELVRKGIKTE